MELRSYQYRAIDDLRKSLLAGNRRVVIQSPTGSGKCLGIGTPVLRYDGTIVPVEAVMAGDLLMGPDSQPRRVLSTCRDSGQLFRIIPIRGEPWVCNDVHVLTLVETKSGDVIDIPLDKRSGSSICISYLPLIMGFNLRTKKTQPFRPIFLVFGLEMGLRRLTGSQLASLTRKSWRNAIELLGCTMLAFEQMAQIARRITLSQSVASQTRF